jgi:hypothetical protein
MDTERLAHLEDVTRRYGRFRPCGAGLGVIWGGILLGALGVSMLQWTRHAYAHGALPSQSFWRFLRDTPLTTPDWLQFAATLAPFVAWTGLVLIQRWVDARFGAVTPQQEACARRLKGPRWMVPGMVIGIGCALAATILWDAGRAAIPGAAAALAISGLAIVWGRHSRDQLTLLVMFAVSVPCIYVMAGTDPYGKLAAGNLIIFATYVVLMLWLVVQGLIRFSGFVKVRADLAAIHPVEE